MQGLRRPAIQSSLASLPSVHCRGRPGHPSARKADHITFLQAVRTFLNRCRGMSCRPSFCEALRRAQGCQCLGTKTIVLNFMFACLPGYLSIWGLEFVVWARVRSSRRRKPDINMTHRKQCQGRQFKSYQSLHRSRHWIINWVQNALGHLESTESLSGGWVGSGH